MYPQRSSALDVVENMWEDFSVYDYPPEASPPREKHAKKKEWTPQITIPKPFTMTMREAKKKAKNMTIVDGRHGVPVVCMSGQKHGGNMRIPPYHLSEKIRTVHSG